MRTRVTALLAVAALGLTLPAVASASTPHTPAARTPIYLDQSYSPAERAADLDSRMTLAEKASQLNSSRAAAIPRLGVAAYGWWNEAAHGVAREQTNDGGNPPTLTNTTSYPVDLSMGSTWDPALMHSEASLISDEAREVVSDNRYDLDFYSPTVNLQRDPRWGRNDETFSEDPLLTADIAAQYVNGLEGKQMDGQLPRSADGYLKAIATVKHFAANNSEYNRRTGSSDMDQRTLREYYTAQFRDIIAQSQPGAIMSSYNEVNGTPAAASVQLMDTLARQTFGFGGYFTSDCDAVYEIQAGHHWTPPNSSTPVDQYSRTAYANSAGEDLDCDQGYHDQYNYGNTIPTALTQDIQTLTDTYNINDVDVSVQRLFTARIETGEFDAQAQVPWVRQARERLAPGTWVNSDANNAVTETPQRLAAARESADASIVLLKNDATAGASLLPLRVPRRGDFRVAVVGQYANPSEVYLGGYSSDQGSAGIANEINPYDGIKAAILQKNANAQVDYLPGTSADFSAVDPVTIAKVKDYDAVIVVGGTNAQTAAEDTDRTSLALPGAQASMIDQVAKANPNTIAYLETLGQVDVSAFAPDVKSILWSSYNGQRAGQALADVVTGSVNPSGHLPFTWYADVNQLPAIGDYAIRPTASTLGRTYMYFTGNVTYPFGYGLSYSPATYSDLAVSSTTPSANDTVTVTATVTNPSSRGGEQVAQVYATTPDAPAALQRPIKRLMAFSKVRVPAHQSRQVSFSIPVRKLAFFDEATNRYTVDDGRYGLQLATSAKDVAAQVFIRVHGSLRPTPSVVTAKPVVAGDAALGIAQRVQFPSGATIDPQLTVSMSDESLYGYITKGQSTSLPDGVRVRYSSNRPGVVRASGTSLTTGRPGVATVTATVSWHGGSSTGQFVVDVS